MELQNQTNKTRLLVVSGGGARGAWGAGFAKTLSDKYGTYSIGFGTSTGSLMLPLVLLNEFGRLKKAYTTLRQEDIFDRNPFKEDGDLKWTVIFRVLTCKKTLGESNNLRKLIDKNLHDDDLTLLHQLGRYFGIAVVDFATGKKEMIFSKDITNASVMKDWIWASSNQPLFMTYHPKKNKPGEPKHFYVDGGVRETVPVTDALQYARLHPEISDIDVIINHPKDPFTGEQFEPKKILEGLLQLTKIWRQEVIENDVLLALQAIQIPGDSSEKINIHLHYFPYSLYPENKEDLVFNEKKMLYMWQAGEKGIEDPVTTIFKRNHFSISRAAIEKYYSEEMQYCQQIS